jgi:hypothetical protein
MKHLSVPLIILSLLSVSCDRNKMSDRALRIRNENLLGTFVLEVSSQDIGFTLTNRAAFIQQVESYALSTNVIAHKTRACFDEIWVNNNPYNWVSNTDQRITVLMGRYKVDSNNILIGMNINGIPTRQNQVPDLGFTKIELNSTR